MDLIDIDNTKTAFSNKETGIAIEYVLKTETDPTEKWLLISHFINYITDEKLLNNTIVLFEGIPFLEKTFTQLTTLDEYIESQGIQKAKDKTKIKAIIYSLSFYCRILLEQYGHFIKNCDIPELRFNIVDRKIEHNFSEITELIKRKSIGSRRDDILNLPTIKEQSAEIKKMIQSMEIVDFDNNTNSLKKYREHLMIVEKTLIEDQQTTSPINKCEFEKQYFKVGLLFAKNDIYSKIIQIENIKTTKYFYLEKEFDNISQLSKHTKLSRQYIDASFKRSKTQPHHNIYSNLKQMRFVVEYCNKNHITIHQDFLNEYTSLVQNQS